MTIDIQRMQDLAQDLVRLQGELDHEVRRRPCDYVTLNRTHLGNLNRTEQCWSTIKQALRVDDPLHHYCALLEYRDADGYRWRPAEPRELLR